MRDSHGVPLCRVIRYIPCKVINRFESKQWLSSSAVFASNIYGTMMRLGGGNKILLIMMLMKLLMMMQVLMLLMIMIYLLVNLILFSIVGNT